MPVTMVSNLTGSVNNPGRPRAVQLVVFRCGRLRDDGRRCKNVLAAGILDDEGAFSYIGGRPGASFKHLSRNPMPSQEHMNDPTYRHVLTCSPHCGSGKTAYPLRRSTAQRLADSAELAADGFLTAWLDS